MSATVEVPADLAGDRLVRVEEFARVAGIGRTTAYAELQAGRIRSVKIGGCRRIAIGEIRRYLASLTGGELAANTGE